MSIRKKINALPDAKRIPSRWKNMQATKESRHPRTKWKEQPLKYVKDTPVAITVFKQMNSRLRHRMFKAMAVEREFSPRKLVSYQPVVSASAILAFAKNPELVHRKKAYVIGTEVGDVVWNGNHRAVAALLAGKKFKAMYLDLVG